MTEQQMTELAVPESALAIGAHPDDIEFGCGGTLAKWAAAGTDVSMLIVTDGSKGTWDSSVPQSDLVAMRQSEQRAAASALGAGQVTMLDHVDGELEYSMALRAEMCRWIRELRPGVVFGHDPWKRYMLHPDHRAAGLGVVDGVVAARDHLFFPDQGLDKHRPDALLLWAADEPDHFEDITETVESKIEALLSHASQGQTTMAGAHEGGDAADEFAAKIREHATRVAENTQFAQAEAFKLITP